MKIITSKVFVSKLAKQPSQYPHWRFKLNHKEKISILRASIFFIICSLSSWSLIAQGPVQDNNNGTWTDSYADQVGVTNPSNIFVSGGSVSLSSCTGSVASGEYTTTLISPSGLSAWEELTINGIADASTLTVEVYQPGGGSLLLSSNTFPLDLSSIDATVNPAIEVRVLLTYSATLPCPTINEMMVSWIPKATLLIQKSGPTEAQADGVVVYRIRLSVSNTNAENIVVYDVLPSLANATVIQPIDYGQDDSPSFSSATGGGIYTVSSVVVNGVSIPANAVYWDLGTVDAGQTLLFTTTIIVPNGTLNGTEYLNDFVAESTNAENKTSNIVSTLISSTPNPIIKKICSGDDVVFDETTYFVIPDGTVTFTVEGRNGSGSGRETMLGSVMYDDLTEICALVDCTAPGIIDNITGGGTLYDPGTNPIGAFWGIIWNLPAIDPAPGTGELTPSASNTQTYSVDLTGVTPGTQFNNTVCLDSDYSNLVCKTIPIEILTTTPIGISSKIDDVRTFTRYGALYKYYLGFKNLGISSLNDFMIFDRVPDEVTFQSITVNSNANSTVFYSTNTTYTDLSIPPDYDIGPIDGIAPTDIDTGGNTYWSSTPPVDPSTVTWIAIYTPQLSSVFFPPDDPVTQVYATLDVRVRDDGDLCIDQNILNRGLFQVNAYTTPAPASVLTPLIGAPFLVADEITRVSPFNPQIDISSASWSVNPQPLDINSENEQTINLTFSNSSSADVATDVNVTLNWGQIEIDGIPQYPTLVNATGGTLDLSNIATGELLFNVGSMLPGENKTISITLFVNSGILDLNNPNYFINANISANDDLCGDVLFSSATTAQLVSPPQLEVFKDVSPTLLAPGDTLQYELLYKNQGPGSSTETYVVDAIPDKTVFIDAELPNGEQLYCSSSPLDAALPSGLTPLSAINASSIASSFVLGTDTGGGTWECPDGEETTWVAFLVDDTSLSPPQLPVNIPTQSVFINLRNDEDKDPLVQLDSPNGTVFFNAPAIFSNELLQAIGNSVLTVVSSQAALKIKKTGPSIVSASDTFVWSIEYENNSSASIPLATITDALPPGLSFISAKHTWNTIAINNGAPAGTLDIFPNGDDYEIAPTFRGGDLLGKEGGTITITVQLDGTQTSGELILNQACANGQNILMANLPQVCDQHIVEVQNPELIINKLASPSNPRSGDTVTYTLIVANLNMVDAPDIEITDTLPLGTSYVPGSIQLVSAVYSIGEPTVSGQVLSWTTANGNALTNLNLGNATIAGNSGDIVIQYQVLLQAGIASGTSLTNQAIISTSSAEDGVFPSADCGGPVGTVGFQNEDCATVTTPFPDPTISKTGTIVINPGETANWNITYTNNNNEDATDVYIVDTLPDYGDGDIDTDITFTSTSGSYPSGTIPTTNIYYNTASGTAPTFNPASPTDNGWSNSPTPTVNHIAWLIGDLPARSGPFSISVSAQMVDPSTGVEVPAGQSFINNATIFSSTVDEDPSNNNDDHETITPGVDMAIEKSASLEGAVPGIAPGDTIDYTLTFTNTGTQTAYGVYIEDTLPTGVTLTEDNFTILTLTNDGGGSCTPVDEAGITIAGIVAVERTGSTAIPQWYLGTQSGYQSVGIPPGCTGSFTFTATLDDTITEFTALTNTVRLYTDNRITDGPPSSPDTDPFDCNENFCDNNEDNTSVTVFLANVMVNKTVVDAVSGSNSETEAGNILTYTIEYNNIGNIDAANTTISEIIPDGTTYVPGSLVAPLDTTVSFNPAADATATDFTISFNEPLPAPATFFGETLTCQTPDDCNLSNTTGEVFGGELIVVTDNVSDEFQFNRPESGLLSPNGIGDIDGNGVDDFFIEGGNILFFDSSFNIISEQAVPSGGTGVAKLGDYDGDGVPDIVTGSNIILFNFDGTIKSTISLTAAGSGLVNSPTGLGAGQVTNIGDIDGDGTTDIAITGDNRLLIIRLNPYSSAPAIVKSDVVIDIDTTSGFPYPCSNSFRCTDNRWHSLAGLGDIDGDGVGDLALGQAFAGPSGDDGSINILFLNSDGTLKLLSAFTRADLPDPLAARSFIRFGSSGTAIPDINGDGLNDLVFGSSDSNGIYSVISLNPDGTVKQNWDIHDDTDFDMFFIRGRGLGFLGDTDGDGLVEIAITSGNSSFPKQINIHELDFGVSQTGTLEYPLSVNGNVLDWKSLSVSDEVPVGTSLLYSIGRQVAGVCTYDLGVEFTDIDLGDENFLSLDNLSTGLTDICFKAEFAPDSNRLITPSLTDWRIAYIADQNPSFSFQVMVDDPYTDNGEIDNTVTISTTTPETTLEDNQDNDKIFINRADLEITKDVDFTAVSLTDVLTYTINYQNNGVNDAVDWSIEDVLPENVDTPSSIVASNTSLGNTVTCMGDATIYCSNNVTQNQSAYSVGQDDDQLIVHDVNTLATLNSITLTSSSGAIGGTRGLTYNANIDDGFIVITRPGDTDTRILGTVNLTTGVVTEIGTLPGRIRDIAYDSVSGRLYGSDASSTEYIEINPVDATQISVVIPPTYFVNTVAFNEDDGLLYGTGFDSGSFDPEFFSIDLGTGSVNTLFITAGNRYSTLEYTGNGIFYGYDYDNDLFNIIDINTNTETPITPNVSRITRGQGLIVNNELNFSGTLAPGESGTITITVPIDVGTPLGSLLTNNVCIESETWDPDNSNNCDTATTVVGDYANIYITKEGPASANLGDTISYTLNYGNNGNIDATVVVLDDVLPPGCVYDATAMGVTSPLPDMVSGQTLTWNTLGATAGTLIPGETGSLTIGCTITDLNLVGTTITNNTVISTMTPELTTTDNSDDQDTVVDVLLAQISGTVFYDSNQDIVYDASEVPISGVTVTLTGTDIFGNAVNLSTTTDVNGDYYFIGINPGDYVVTETQPIAYDSTGAAVGTIDNIVLGTVNTTDEIGGISVSGGDIAIDYDFGELATSVLVSKTLASETGGLIAGSAEQGETLGYDIAFDNTLGGATVFLTITETVPVGTTYAGGDDFEGASPLCTIGDPAGTTCERTISVGAGTISSLTFNVTVDNPLAGGITDITNTILVNNGECPGGVGNDCEEITPVALIDYGDAPDTYATTQADDGGEGIGASHIIDNVLYFGATIDGESDGQPSVLADGDGVDEDGIAVFPQILDSVENYTVPFTVTNLSGANASVGAWIDFDQSGTFEADEFTVETIAPGATAGILIWTDFPGIIAGTTYARFRISNNVIIASEFVGMFPDGEIEDYQIVIEPTIYDFGDAPDTYATNLSDDAFEGIGPSHILNNSMTYLGAVVDDDPDGQPSVLSDGDDTDIDGDDEEGIVAFPQILDNAVTYDLAFAATNTSGMNASIGAWIDFDQSGTFEANEFTVTTIANGASGGTLTWTNFPGITSGVTYARIRISTEVIIATDWVGELPDGEVEDYQITIEPTLFDFGDAPDTYATDLTDGGEGIGPSHIINNTMTFLGALVDDEPDGQANVLADGDDTDVAGDDEEGIAAFPQLEDDALIYNLPFTATNTSGVNATVGAWIDFDQSGTFEADEFTVITIANGATGGILTWTSLPGITSGVTYVRIRISTEVIIATDWVGELSDGEVEDYQITIAAPDISLLKTALPLSDTNGDGTVGGLGDTINYSFTVENTGNVMLTNIIVTDPLVAVVGGPIATLAVGGIDTTTFTATYVITQADIDAGVVTNTATVSGDDPGGNPVTDDSDDPSDPTDDDPDGDGDPDDPTDTPLTQNPDISLLKTAAVLTDTNGDGVVGGLGDTINYSFTVENTGDVTLTNVTLTDVQATVSGGPIGTLAVGGIDTTTFTATYVITQADIDAGIVTNTATVSGDDPGGNPVTDDSDDPSDPTDDDPDGDGDPDDPTDTPLTQNPDISLLKTAAVLTDTNGDGTVGGLGDTINYSFTVENTGNVMLTNIIVTDPLVAVVGGPIGTLAVGGIDTTTFTATYVIVQADIDAGVVTNTATVSGDDPGGNPVTDDSDDPSDPTDDDPDGDGDPDDPTDTPLTQNPDISLLKTAAVLTDTNGDGTVGGLGDTINYSFTVENTGDVTLTNVTLTDVQATVSGGPIGTLAVGGIDTTTFTATYVIVQVDIDAGVVTNTATVSGDDPGGNPVTDDSDDPSDPTDDDPDGDGDPDDPTDTPLTQNPDISLLKTAAVLTDTNGDGVVGGLGDTISYNFTVENTGDVTLTNVTLTDVQATVSGGPIATLAVGGIDTTTFTATYVIVQADIDAGVVTNTATVSGDDPGGNPVTDDSDDPSDPTDDDPDGDGDPDDPTDTPLTQNPDISLLKTAAVLTDTNGDGTVGGLGDTISYSFTVENTGDVTLTNVTLTDVQATVSGGPIATLAVGGIDNTTFTATYVITQADIDAGIVTNTATVSGDDPGGNPVTDDSDDPSDPTDDDPDGDGDPDDPTDTPLTQNPDISLLKTAAVLTDTNGDGVVGGLGDTISYSFTVENTGDVTLTNVTLTDVLATVSGGPIATLAVGGIDTTTFTATYVIVQADIDAGVVTNTATVSGDDPGGNPVTDDSDDPSDPTDDDPDGDGDPDDPTDTPLTQNPDISLLKTAAVLTDTNGDGVVGGLGDTISYNFTVENTGDVTLTNVTLTDVQATVSGGPIATLAVGGIDTTTFTATYVIVQADIDAGVVTNTATVSGDDPGGNPVTDDSDDPSDPTDDDPDGDGDPDDPTDTPLTQNPDISLLKTAAVLTDTNGDGVVGGLGDTISYNFTVENTGDVTLTNVIVTDPLVAVVGGPIASMDPGDIDTTTFTATYVIVQADIDAGVVTNTATVSGDDPGGNPVTDDSDDPSDPTDDDPDGDDDPDDPTDTPLTQNPDISLLKTAAVLTDTNGDGTVGGLGDTISYSFTVENTGDVTLTNVIVTDPLVAVVGGPIASMDPGDIDTTTFTATYVITQADIDAGIVTNTATVSGDDPGGNPVTDDSDDPSDPTDDDPDGDGDPDDPTDTPLTQNPDISLLKTAAVLTDTNGDGVVGGLGDTINYSFTVENTGDVTLTNVTLSDVQATVSGGPIATLAVGGIDTTTFTATYVIVQADIDAGVVTNTATVSGDDPGGNPVTDDSDDPSDPTDDDPDGDGDPDDPTDTPLTQNPDISLLKTAAVLTDTNGDGTVGGLGDTISYSFTVENTGDVTLTNVTISDPLLVFPQGTISGGPIATLAVGGIDTTTFTGSYIITQADIDAGVVTNTATVSGDDPGGNPVTDDSDDPSDPTDDDPDGDGNPDDPTVTTLTLVPTSNISLLKTAAVLTDTNGDGVVGGLGDTINYSFTVENTGNVMLTNVIVTDPLVAVVGGPIASMDPGDIDTTTFTATYVITQTDVDAGMIINVAMVESISPSSAVVVDISDDPSDPSDDDPDSDGDPDDPTVIMLDQIVFDLMVEKTVDNPTPMVGEEVTFTITITNVGQQTATLIEVEELLPSGYSYVIHTASAGIYTESTGLWSIDQLDPDQSESLNITVEVLGFGDYLNTATVVSSVGGVDENPSDDSDTGEVEPLCLIIYNEFSPNGDGTNEFFVIDCIEQYPNNTLKVYNRWGNVVYQANGYLNDWDGTSNGRATVNTSDKLPVGTYYYVLDIGDGSEPRVGWLYINR